MLGGPPPRVNRCVTGRKNIPLPRLGGEGRVRGPNGVGEGSDQSDVLRCAIPLLEEDISMKLGVVFPQTEIGSDPAVVRDYAQAAESAGYDHLLVFDHVLGGTLERFDTLGRRPPYTDQSPFHEVFVLFGFLSACTQKLEMVTRHRDPAPAPDRAGGQAGRGGRRANSRALAPRRGHRLEPRRVR